MRLEKRAPRFAFRLPLCQPADSPLLPPRLMRIHPLITKSDELSDLVSRLSKQPFIAVDTEFMRENTYWPELCLLQVASSEEAAAIDPQCELDLAPILDLLVENREVL